MQRPSGTQPVPAMRKTPTNASESGPSNYIMPIRLVGIGLCGQIIHGHVRCSGRMGSRCTGVGCSDALVVVRRRLDLRLWIVASARATADAEEPEQSGGPGEENGGPGGDEHLAAQRALYSVGPEDRVEAADQGAVYAADEAGGDEGGEGSDLGMLLVICDEQQHGRGETYARNNGRDEATPPTHNGKETQQKLYSRSYYGHNVEYEDPSSQPFVRSNSRPQILWYGAFNILLILQAPLGDRVEVIPTHRLATFVKLGHTVRDGAAAGVP